MAIFVCSSLSSKLDMAVTCTMCQMEWGYMGDTAITNTKPSDMCPPTHYLKCHILRHPPLQMPPLLPHSLSDQSYTSSLDPT